MATPGSMGDPAKIAADARLIAAAPELLVVAKMALAAAMMELGEATAPDFSPTEMRDAARAAIAKASDVTEGADHGR